MKLLCFFILSFSLYANGLVGETQNTVNDQLPDGWHLAQSAILKLKNAVSKDQKMELTGKVELKVQGQKIPVNASEVVLKGDSKVLLSSKTGNNGFYQITLKKQYLVSNKKLIIEVMNKDLKCPARLIDPIDTKFSTLITCTQVKKPVAVPKK